MQYRIYVNNHIKCINYSLFAHQSNLISIEQLGLKPIVVQVPDNTRDEDFKKFMESLKK